MQLPACLRWSKRTNNLIIIVIYRRATTMTTTNMSSQNSTHTGGFGELCPASGHVIYLIADASSSLYFQQTDKNELAGMNMDCTGESERSESWHRQIRPQLANATRQIGNCLRWGIAWRYLEARADWHNGLCNSSRWLRRGELIAMRSNLAKTFLISEALACSFHHVFPPGFRIEPVHLDQVAS